MLTSARVVFLILLGFLANPAPAFAAHRQIPQRVTLRQAAAPARHRQNPEPVASTRQHISPERFFAGRTEGRGALRILLAAPRAIRVHGTGRLTKDGTLVLRQTVQQGDEPAESREWRLRRVSATRFEGTLTDASGPVRGEISGNRLHLGYFTKAGVRIDQSITFDPSGRVADNRLTARILGLPVALLDETIAKTR